MIKIIYQSEPFYGGEGLNEPCFKNLEVTFDDEATYFEILNEIIRILKYAGYTYIDRKSKLLEAIDYLVHDGVVFDDTELNKRV